MEQVYKMNLWGKGNTPFYSGDGSHESKIVIPFIKVVMAFLKSFKESITVCDLGCGDFNIGKELVAHTLAYTAIDIVPALINYNREQFKNERLKFYCLNIATDLLPVADCLIIRQVLQHLSNEEILSIVNKISVYKYIILTEHLPSQNFIPNLDIISGQGIRIKKKSGVDLLAAPFYLDIKEQKELHCLELENDKGKIVTTLYTVF